MIEIGTMIIVKRKIRHNGKTKMIETYNMNWSDAFKNFLKGEVYEKR